MKILITGSKGFIGKHLTAELKDHELIKIDKTLGHDILNLKETPKFDIAIHLAAITFVPFSFDNPELTYQINVKGTQNILELCKKNNAGIVFNSSYVYGKPKYLPIDEKHPLQPGNPYAESKVKAEQLIQSSGVPYIILRPSNVYGPGQNENMLIPTILKQKETITLKDSKPKRDMLHVKDMVSALKKSLNLKNEIINIGLGKSYSVEEIVNILKKPDQEVKYTNEARPNEIPDCYYNISKAKEILNWQPTINLEQGLASLQTP